MSVNVPSKPCCRSVRAATLPARPAPMTTTRRRAPFLKLTPITYWLPGGVHGHRHLAPAGVVPVRQHRRPLELVLAPAPGDLRADGPLRPAGPHQAQSRGPEAARPPLGRVLDVQLAQPAVE